MTQSELKELKAIGAELGAAKAENERLRGLLRRVTDELDDLNSAWLEQADDCAEPDEEREFCDATKELIDEVRANLSQQAEPTDTYTAVEMATAAAQGLRDGQAAVEQAAAKDETEPVYQFQWREIGEGDWMACSHSWFRFCEASPEHDTRVVEVARPAQTEQQPIRLPQRKNLDGLLDPESKRAGRAYNEALEDVELLNAAPIAQTAPQPERWQAACGDWRETSVAIHGEKSGYITCGIPEDKAHAIIKAHNSGLSDECAALSAQGAGKFAMHQRVRKTSGSEWQGRICGTYSTALTPEGYAVESSAHRNSVQIYPAKALEAVDE